ncbi:hypothetical protein SLA2020_069390 [Shorea laevis]
MAKKQWRWIQATPVDRISYLPDGILHQILSYLHIKVVARTSVLSKRWQHLWYSFPFFDFAQYEFYDPRKRIDDLETFTDIVDGKLKSFCKYEHVIQRFNLQFSCIEPEYHSLVDKWMRLVTKRHVRELTFYANLPYTNKKNLYSLPSEVFVSNSLTVLEIFCKNTLFPRYVNLPRLVSLRLTDVKIDVMLVFDDDKFPCIEVMQLRNCIIPIGFKICCHRLKELEINDRKQRGEIEIFAPNLSSILQIS